jgi:hypothetical protein
MDTRMTKRRNFSDKIKKVENKEGEIKELHAKIGQLVTCPPKLPSF